MVLVLSPVSGQPNEVLELATLGQSTQLVQTREIDDPELSGWVWIERYLPAAGGDLRGAIVLATTEHGLPGTTYVLPAGTYQWPGAPFAPANNTTWIGYGCTIERDMAGVASGQIFFFLRTDTGAGHADRIVFRGGRFRLLNVLTSFFSAAIQLDAASNCLIEDATAECTFDAAATQGRIRWGLNLLGGNLALGQGVNNRIVGSELSFAQLQLCGAGRSALNVIADRTMVRDANDVAVSVVSTGATQRLENVTIRDVSCENVAGSNVVFAGTDGAGIGIGVGTLRNVNIDGVWFTGQRSTPDLDFPFTIGVQVAGGLVTEHVTVGNVGSRLSPNASLQARSVQISSQDDEVSWHGLSLHDLQLGVVTSNDPLEALLISGRNISGCEIDNVTVDGLRGIRIQDVDHLVANNLVTLDGSLTVIAASRNLDSLSFAGCNIARVTGFTPSIAFVSGAARSMSRVMLANIVSTANGVSLNTALTGGTMSMWIANFEATNAANPTAETLAGIVRIKSVRGWTALVPVSVVVPAVAAGSVGYVDVSMAGTRLADLAIGEPVVANPTADLVAAGVGGAYVNARVSALGTVRMAFLGPLAGGAVNFNFDRAN